MQQVIPICQKYQIRAACHPHDPGVPPEGYQGITRVLGTVDGLKKFISLNDSPYHGLNLCLGTTAEMLLDPAREIHDVIRYFGTRKRIFNIHFRNIRGHRDHFQEVYPDEGDMDMLQVLRTLYEVDYPYMVMQTICHDMKTTQKADRLLPLDSDTLRDCYRPLLMSTDDRLKTII